MEASRFREDLFYRLNVIPVTVPATPGKAGGHTKACGTTSLINSNNPEGANIVKGLTPESMEKLLHYSWPGNIRELENIIERMVILAENDISGSWKTSLQE